MTFWKHKSNHVTRLFTALKWLFISLGVRIEVLHYPIKALFDLIISLTLASLPPAHCSSHTSLLAIPWNLSNSLRGICICSSLWNALPLDIFMAHSLVNLKTLLNCHLKMKFYLPTLFKRAAASYWGPPQSNPTFLISFPGLPHPR